jgi:pyridoxal phosphate enzyme (YggS family)
MSGLAHNLATVRARLHEAARRFGYNEIKLVAVTKTVPPECIAEALALGLRSFGENRVQEALPKIMRFPDADWHFIGRLQTNKAKDVVGCFSLVQSLDRWKLACALQQQAETKGVLVNVLVQVNVAGEKQKGGVAPGELYDFLAAAAGLPNIRVQGLMAIPPYTPDAEEVRPYFKQMYRLFRECPVPGVQMQILSMGMSGDYAVAVEEGANMVRVGSALFGERN